MRTFQLSIISFVFILLAQTSFAQKTKETIKVAGECGMCKTKIEASAKNAGATYAVWDVASKELTVKYNGNSSSNDKIQQEIAKVGYDTPKYKATEEAYDGLHECCKYDRSSDAESKCCDGEKCTEGKCMKDGKCTPDMSCCKDSGCADKDCCKKS
jgi:ribonuclease BN (tRNA processing enzyme)